MEVSYVRQALGCLSGLGRPPRKHPLSEKFLILASSSAMIPGPGSLGEVPSSSQEEASSPLLDKEVPHKSNHSATHCLSPTQPGT